MLDANVVVFHALSLFLGEAQHFAGALGEPL
jgi:hypothetical protein